MNVYADESGDLGFSFDKPFRHGGSSRFLTISFFVIPKPISHYSERIIKKMYDSRKRKPTNELKGGDLSEQERLFFAGRVCDLISRDTRIKVFSITVNKENVQSHIKEDPNKLYNYMIGLILPDYIKEFPAVTFIPDQRSVKVSSGNSMIDYLKIKLWFELDVKTRIRNIPKESHKELNLQFIDFICHIVWGRYEDNRNDAAYKKLVPRISERHLFFS